MNLERKKEKRKKFIYLALGTMHRKTQKKTNEINLVITIHVMKAKLICI